MKNDFELINKIFNCIDNRLVDDYDSFVYMVEVFDGYQESEIVVTKNGITTDNPRLQDGAPSPYDFISELKKGAVLRGEGWKSFTLSYQKGGQVSVKYTYE